MREKIEELEIKLWAMPIFREAVGLPAAAALRKLLRGLCGPDADIRADIENYTEVFRLLREAGNSSIGEHVFSAVKYGETVYARAAAAGACDSELRREAERELDTLRELCGLSCAEIKAELNKKTGGRYAAIVDALPEWENGGDMTAAELEKFFRANGAGEFARHRAFLWSDMKYTPILAPDPIDPSEMIGYEWQRNAVLENTRALMDGKLVNNILLFGDSGTGKSATVKSMLNVPEFTSLRIIEIAKHCLMQIPELMRELAGRPQKFILFIDDLSFEDGDKNYSALKVILEGGMEQRPKNVAIYVTSNRRQLIKRRFSERDDEIDKGESAQEKTSLSDRFGLRIPYLALGRAEFLDMAESLAKRAGCALPPEEIRREALKWEMEHGGRTPRVACQFAEFIGNA